MAEVDRLLNLVGEYFPLGKDEWERVAGFFNATRALRWPDRDSESLRRKFKVLYSTRKPTGTPEMPPRIKRDKELKEAIDEKANVTVMDDGADDDQQDMQPDFCFDVDPDDDFESHGDGAAQAVGAAGQAGSVGLAQQVAVGGDHSNDGGSTASSRLSTRGEFQDLLVSSFISEGQDIFPDTPRPAPPGRTTRAKTRKSTTPTAWALQQAKQQGSSKNRDDPEEPKAPKYQNYSNRLGCSDLTGFRDTVGSKRSFDGDKDLLEASYAKAKRIRAVKTTAALKSKLDGLENSANTMGGSILETLLLLREENERKAEARWAEDEQRRRDDVAAREDRFLADKAEAEERGRQDKLDMEERARRDKEEARARTQELILLIGTLNKKA